MHRAERLREGAGRFRERLRGRLRGSRAASRRRRPDVARATPSSVTSPSAVRRTAGRRRPAVPAELAERVSRRVRARPGSSASTSPAARWPRARSGCPSGTSSATPPWCALAVTASMIGAPRREPHAGALASTSTGPRSPSSVTSLARGAHARAAARGRSPARRRARPSSSTGPPMRSSSHAVVAGLAVDVPATSSRPRRPCSTRHARVARRSARAARRGRTSRPRRARHVRRRHRRVLAAHLQVAAHVLGRQLAVRERHVERARLAPPRSPCSASSFGAAGRHPRP